MASEHLTAARLKRAMALQNEAVWLLRSALDLRWLAAQTTITAQSTALRVELAARLTAPQLRDAPLDAIITLATRLEREAAALTSACANTLRGMRP